jgi:hypothetical protein
MGMVLLAMDDPAKALLDFDEAIRLSPLMGRAYSNAPKPGRRLAIGLERRRTYVEPASLAFVSALKTSRFVENCR